ADASIHHLHHTGKDPRLQQVDHLTLVPACDAHAFTLGDLPRTDKTAPGSQMPNHRGSTMASHVVRLFTRLRVNPVKLSSPLPARIRLVVRLIPAALRTLLLMNLCLPPTHAAITDLNVL